MSKPWSTSEINSRCDRTYYTNLPIQEGNPAMKNLLQAVPGFDRATFYLSGKALAHTPQS